MDRITFLGEIKNAENGLTPSSAFNYSDVRNLLTKMLISLLLTFKLIIK